MELLTRSEVAAMCKVSVWTWDRAVKAKLAPQPIHPMHPGGHPRWVRSEVELWLEHVPTGVLEETRSA